MTNSGTIRVKLFRSAAVNASKRSRLTQAASGARIDSSGSVNPVFGPKQRPLPSALAQMPSSSKTSVPNPPPSTKLGDIKVNSPFGSRSILSSSLSAQNRASSSSLSQRSKRSRTGNSVSARARFTSSVYARRGRAAKAWPQFQMWLSSSTKPATQSSPLTKAGVRALRARDQDDISPSPCGMGRRARPTPRRCVSRAASSVAVPRG